MNVYSSQQLTFGDFLAQIFDKLFFYLNLLIPGKIKPFSIISTYSIPSIFLVGIFIIAKSLDKHVASIYKLLNSKINSNESVSDRGYAAVHIFILMVIFFIDFYHHCNEEYKTNTIVENDTNPEEKQENLLKINFPMALTQNLLTILPLYAFLYLIQKIPFYSIFRKAIADTDLMMINLFEGFVVFILYNWAMNYRKHNNYNICSLVTYEDIEQKVLKLRNAAYLKGNYDVWNNRKFSIGPRKKPKKSKTVTTIIQTSYGNVPPKVFKTKTDAPTVTITSGSSGIKPASTEENTKQNTTENEKDNERHNESGNEMQNANTMKKEEYEGYQPYQNYPRYNRYQRC